MRADAANLLNRLGRNKFRYQEFRDAFADIELWPLFEALIADPRISGSDGGFEAATVEAAFADEGDVMPVARTATTRGGLFGRYEAPAPAAATPPPPARPQEDVRALLHRLNDRVANGGL